MVWPSIIGGIAAILAASIGVINRQKLKDIHVLVNSRLDQALNEIDLLKRSLKFEKTQAPTESESDDTELG